MKTSNRERAIELFLQEARSRIGMEKELEDIEVEKGSIRRYAEAILSSNPIYTNEDYAIKRGFSSVTAPPLFLCGVPPTGIIPDAPEGLLGLHGADEWEIFIPVLGGDRITRKGKLIEIVEKEGKTGKMYFFKMELTFTNKMGEFVARYWPTVIFLERKGESSCQRSTLRK